jgi:hypothetical protein
LGTLEYTSPISDSPSPNFRCVQKANGALNLPGFHPNVRNRYTRIHLEKTTGPLNYFGSGYLRLACLASSAWLQVKFLQESFPAFDVLLGTRCVSAQIDRFSYFYTENRHYCIRRELSLVSRVPCMRCIDLGGRNRREGGEMHAFEYAHFEPSQEQIRDLLLTKTLQSCSVRPWVLLASE